MGGGNSIIDEDFQNKMEEIIGESIKKIPAMYAAEQNRIVREMQRASPRPYEGLLYVDYPTRNRADVNDLARRRVISKRLKDEISEEVYRNLEPTIEDKTAGMNSIASWLAKKAAKKAINVAVSRAVDAIVLNDDNPSTTASKDQR